MPEQTTITLQKTQKAILDENRGGVPWGKYLVSKIEGEPETVRIDPDQVDRIVDLVCDQLRRELKEQLCDELDPNGYQP